MINSFRGEYNWLSNMSTCEILLDGHIFKSVENAYMASKNLEDRDWFEICLTQPPNICKKLSKNIKLRLDWEDVKLGIMYNFLLQKYTKEPFKSKLLATGNENIQEGNFWNDIFWGVDLKQNPNIGENHLGRLIMYIRILIRQNKL